MKKIMIIIPTYNEKANIELIVKALIDKGKGFYITIVDDNSPDGTGEIVDRLVKEHSPYVSVIHRAGKLGLGTAYIEGFKYALDNGAEYVIEMDADFSHDPRYLEPMLEAMEENDLVLGSRYLNGVRVDNWPFRRLLMSKFANLYVQFIAPLPIEDSTSGFKCFRREVLESIDFSNIHSEGYAFQIEMTFKAYKKGYKVGEIPITFFERKGGFSKMERKIALEAFWLVLKMRLGLVA